MPDSQKITPAASASDRPLVVTFWLMLLVALWCWSLSWNAPILDRHEFRQLQTAESTYWLKQDGFRLNYETPLFGPPSWSIPMEFPVYEWCVAKVSGATGLPLDQSGRATSILFLLATLPAICGLAGLSGLSRPGRLLVAAAVLSSPVYLFYGRTFMIESTALCFSTWFLLGIGRCVRDLSWRWSLIATICGVLAALAKVTTFAVYCFPAAGLALWLGWPYWKARKTSASRVCSALALCCIPVLISVIVGQKWVQHADAIKDANPFSGFLKSSEMTAWNWGTLDQRLSLSVWNEVWSNVRQFVLSESAAVVVLIAATLVASGMRRFALASAVAFLAGPLLFTNLYFRHDYYYSANALLLLGAAGVLLAGVWNAKPLPRPAKLAALALFFGAQLLCFYRGYGFNHRRQLPQPPGIASVIRETVPRNGVVLIYGWDWDSRIAYYSQRRVIMVPDGREREIKVLEDILGQLPPLQIEAVLIKQRDNAPIDSAFIRERIRRFDLVPVPIASSADGDLYLTRERMASVAEKILHLNAPGVSLNSQRPAGSDREEALKRDDVSKLKLPGMKLFPTSGRSMYGLTMAEYEGQPAILAHPVSELYFTPPAKADRIEVEFGIAAAAYASPGGAITDGVGVEIIEQRPDGLRRVLYQCDLDPVHRSVDRGPQRAKIEGRGPFSGQLIFRMNPGPNGNFINDWVFWRRIVIE